MLMVPSLTMLEVLLRWQPWVRTSVSAPMPWTLLETPLLPLERVSRLDLLPLCHWLCLVPTWCRLTSLSRTPPFWTLRYVPACAGCLCGSTAPHCHVTPSQTLQAGWKGCDMQAVMQALSGTPSCLNTQSHASCAAHSVMSTQSTLSGTDITCLKAATGTHWPPAW